MVHEILPPGAFDSEPPPSAYPFNFKFQSANYIGGYEGDPIKQSTFRDEDSGKDLPSVVFGWTGKNRFFRPGETRTVEIKGMYPAPPENPGKTLREKIEHQLFDLGGNTENYYTAAAYILGGCIKTEPPDPMVAALVGEFVDLHDPLRKDDYGDKESLFRSMEHSVRGKYGDEMLEQVRDVLRVLAGSHLFVAVANQGKQGVDDPLKIVDINYQLLERRPPQHLLLDHQDDRANKLTVYFGGEVYGSDGLPEALRTGELHVYEALYDESFPHICVPTGGRSWHIPFGEPPFVPSSLPHRLKIMADLDDLTGLVAPGLDWKLRPSECYIMVFSGYEFLGGPVIYHSALEIVATRETLRPGPRNCETDNCFAVDDLEPSTIREAATVVEPGRIEFPP